eukprot:SAG11_NODE_3356_length_2505_cov_1.647548_2_plen_54_part_00
MRRMVVVSETNTNCTTMTTMKIEYTHDIVIIMLMFCVALVIIERGSGCAASAS